MQAAAPVNGWALRMALRLAERGHGLYVANSEHFLPPALSGVTKMSRI
jgi:hypothetical protein